MPHFTNWNENHLKEYRYNIVKRGRKNCQFVDEWKPISNVSSLVYTRSMISGSTSMLDQLNSIDRVEQMHDIYDNNKVTTLIVGYESVAMIDTGSTLSTISRVLYEIISHYTGLTIWKDHSTRCSLADGSEIVLDECVNVLLKINKVSLEARLFILDIEHINVIIGCDLLNAMNARIDFGSHRLINHCWEQNMYS